MSDRPRYMIMSADSHAGADILDYKPYLASAFHDEFDAWAPTFRDAWTVFDDELTYTDNPAIRLGITSFLSPYNWDHEKRIEHMDDQGIAGEVVLPNTVPPFYESGTTTSGQPVSDEDYRRRWAGVQAHNRWLVDFCALAPARRAGIAQVYLGDIDAAVEEVRWAKENGLRGVLVPSDSHSRLVNLYERRLDPFWAVCEDLEMPVRRHSISVNLPEDENVGPGGVAVGAHETMLFFHRGLAHLIIGGVFERFPGLKFIFVETGAGWIRPELDQIEYQMSLGSQRGHMLYPFWHRAAEELSLTPTEYFARNCFLGASLTTRSDIEARYDVGVDNILWGADYPHHEGTWPHTELVLRALFSGVPEDEVRKMLGITAAQLYGMDVSVLQSIADRIGPSVEAIDRPVTIDEIPTGSYNMALTDIEAPMPRM
jgi:predicted TIM-barrel fold metal-dependent hydrolase